MSWTPPERPEWVARINQEGRHMDIAAVVPLDEDSLLRSAMQATGLTDFGAEDWREHFRVFVRALDSEANLNLLGRIRTRSEVVELLKSRLQIEDVFKRHPEINDEEITKPIIVIGQGRSGTSYLYNLLATDPDNGPLLTWECLLPCPPPEAATYRSDPRIERAHQLITQWVRVTPTMESMHEFAGTSPLECLALKGLNFAAPHWFMAFGQVPSYNNYIAKVDMLPTYRYYRRVLQLLQWKNPRKRWVLKSMSHLDYLPELMKVLPDACLVWSHRDPVKSMRSTASFLLLYNWGRSDSYELKSSAHDTASVAVADRLTRPIDWIEHGRVPARQLYHIQYPDLIRDPVGTLTAVYRHFDIDFSSAARQALDDYLQANPRTARPPHQYAVSAESVEHTRAAFRRYQDYFKVPTE